MKTRKSAMILGPRQVGKSTLLKALKPDLIINLALQDQFLEYASNPKALLESIETQSPSTVFIDEIQRLPSLLNTIQAIIDDKTKIRFFLTGSSARKLKRGKANLLPGRILDYRLGPLVSKELDYKMDSSQVLMRGTLPQVYLSSSDALAKKELLSYSALYLKEEIQAEALTRNLESFSRFLVSVSQTMGEFIDYSKLAKIAKISRHSCARYFEVLEDTLIADRIFPHPEMALSHDLIKHPKLYFFDGGVYNGLVKNFTPSPDRKGALFEQLIYSQVKHSCSALDLQLETYTFRTRGGYEIDFIFKIENQFFALECKATDDPNSDDVRSLKSIQTYLPSLKNKFLVHLGKKTKKIDGIWTMPWQEVLKELGV